MHEVFHSVDKSNWIKSKTYSIFNSLKNLIINNHSQNFHFSFLSLGHNQSWTISLLEHILLRTASSLTPDQACKSYPRAARLNKLLGAKVITMTSTPSDNMNIYDSKGKIEVDYNREEEEMDWSEEFIRLVSAILSAVEQCLIRQCARAMRCNAWQRMDIELRNKIQKLACLSEPTDDRKSRSRVSHTKTVRY